MPPVLALGRYLPISVGDLYVVTRVLLTPTQLGWPCARLRQYVVLYLKSRIHPAVR